MIKAKAKKCHYTPNGLSKRILVLKGQAKSGFEEAIFVLREEDGISSRDFLQEAQQLMESVAEHPPSRSVRPILWTLSGLTILLSLSWVLFFLMR